MTDKPRRPWFQLHLSTAIVTMFVAGGMIWANVTERIVAVSGIGSMGDPIRPKIGYGYPFAFFERVACATDLDVHLVRISGIDLEKTSFAGGPLVPKPTFDWRFLCVDVFIALSIIVVFSFCHALWLRRKEQLNKR